MTDTTTVEPPKAKFITQYKERIFPKDLKLDPDMNKAQQTQCDCQKHGEPFEDCPEHGSVRENSNQFNTTTWRRLPFNLEELDNMLEKVRQDEQKRIASMIDFNMEDVCLKNGKCLHDEDDFISELSRKETND